MENASKALIIAGAILIAILLVSIGIIVMNSINSPLFQAEDEGQIMSAQMYNSRFTTYVGEQKGTKVKELLILMSGMSSEHEGVECKVKLSGESKSGRTYHDYTGYTTNQAAKYILDEETYVVEFLDEDLYQAGIGWGHSTEHDRKI